MENKESINIKIMYMNNVCVKKIGTIEYHKYDNNDFWSSLFKLLSCSTIAINTSQGHFYAVKNHGTIPIEVGEILDPDVSLIVYSEIVSLNNAYQYDEIDGVILYFHTNENNHKFFPHIHASYSGKNMLISLETLETTGSLDNRKKEKIARKYVYQNRHELFKEWNRLIKNI